jgi:hypothetical protein
MRTLLHILTKYSVVKGKVHPRIGHEGPEGELYSFSNFGTRLGVGGGQRHVPAALQPGKKPGSHRRLGRPQGRYGWVRKISAPPRFHLRTVQPVARSYTDYVIRAHIYRCRWLKHMVVFPQHKMTLQHKLQKYAVRVVGRRKCPRSVSSSGLYYLHFEPSSSATTELSMRKRQAVYFCMTNQR